MQAAFEQGGMFRLPGDVKVFAQVTLHIARLFKSHGNIFSLYILSFDQYGELVVSTSAS